VIEIEDQLFPKRAHHHKGIEHLIPLEAMVDKVHAAVDLPRYGEPEVRPVERRAGKVINISSFSAGKGGGDMEG
jgi:hypothetical protein